MGRRSFIKVGVAAGGGLLVGVLLRGSDDSAPSVQGGAAGTGTGSDELNAFVEITTSGIVRITAPCPEIGQGVRTALAQIVAEELDVEWETITVRQGEANSRYGGQAVGGSDSARDYWGPLRRAGATARQLLVLTASDEWAVPGDECDTDLGWVVHGPSGRRAAYGDLASRAARRTQSVEPTLTDPEAFRVVGESPKPVDVEDIVTGTARYGMDVRIPGLLRAVVARSPVLGGRVERFDGTAAEAVPGVEAVVELEPLVPAGDLYAAVRGGVAVVASDTWSAMQGRDVLEIEWSPGDNGTESTTAIERRLESAILEPARHVLREVGDPEGVFGAAARVVERVYTLPMLGHACMEPMNFTAHARADLCELWGPVQVPQRLRAAVSAALGLPVQGVRVHPTLAGGGFGRRLAVDYGVEAAVLSRALDAPVQVIWTRDDDFRGDYCRPPSKHRLRAALSEDGRVVGWDHHVVTASLLAHIERGSGGTHPAIYDVQGAADLPLSVPSLRVGYTPVPIGVQMGSWRSVAHSFNTFVVGSFIHEVAVEAGRDLLEVYGELFDAPGEVAISLPLPGRRGRPRPNAARLRNVLEVAVERSGWDRTLPSGWGRGIACAEYKDSYTAHVAEVEIVPDGFRVHRVLAVLDCGRVINPSGTRAQMEGAVMDGLATVMHWGLTVTDGMISARNFDDYPLLRIGEAPEVVTVLIDSDAAPAGAGEPPYPSVAPAICNAVFDAGGDRIRTLPVAAS